MAPEEYHSDAGRDDAIPPVEDPRSMARQLSLQFLHQLAVQGEDIFNQLDNFLAQYCDNQEARRLARQWISGAWHDKTRIEDMIKSIISNWDWARINLVDRSNLQLAVFQLLNCPEIPFRVVINEAVELAKRFSTTAAPGFINGVLDAIRSRYINKPDNPAPAGIDTENKE